jgi:hypothetical protein
LKRGEYRRETFQRKRFFPDLSFSVRVASLIVPLSVRGSQICSGMTR